MSIVPDHHPFSPAAVPPKRPTDPPAALMGKEPHGRPPLGERSMRDENIMNRDNNVKNSVAVVPNKPPLPLQQPPQLSNSLQRHYATPNHNQLKVVAAENVASNVSQPRRMVQVQPTPSAAGTRAGAPFKSPITLCFERMLGAGKRNNY